MSQRISSQGNMNYSAFVLRAVVLLLVMMHGSDAEMEIIVGEPDFHVGKEILLLCKAGGDGEIKWYKDGQEIENDDEEIVFPIDEANSKVEIKKAKMQDTGTYTCECTFDNGQTVTKAVAIYVHEGPSFAQTATYHEFLEGTDGVVPCVVSGRPFLDVHWLKDKQEISSHGGRRVRQLPDNTLMIEKIRRDDAGTYICHAQIRGRTAVFKELRVSVVVNVAPTVRLREEEKEKKVLAGPETSVSLLCLVDGLPVPNITWTMPLTNDSSRYHFNSDRSQLTIRSITRDDYGEYVCTATNKLGESSAVTMLHVFEAPGVYLSAEMQNVSMGQRVSVSCNVSGHPVPELHWHNKNNGQSLEATTGRVRVVDGELVIEEVMPSDGGLYSCMAVSSFGNASRDVAIHTQPGPPHYLTISSLSTSVLFSLKISPVSGGTPITSFALQWRQSEAEQWKEVIVPASDPLIITDLKQYTTYTVRMAALNAVGLGAFSEKSNIRTLGKREPDRPVLSLDEMKVESNSFSVPLKQINDGGSPLQHFNLRYRQEKEDSEWKEMQLSPETNSISIQDLSFGSGYQLEVTAVNANGSSLPVKFNFTIAEQPAKLSSRSMTKGSVVGIVMLIFLLVFLVVDITCCYRNRCGLLMTIAVKLFGQKIPGLKGFEDGDAANGEVKLKGISTPRGSLNMVQTQEGGQLTEVTCDKASLTKHEKTQPGRDQTNNSK